MAKDRNPIFDVIDSFSEAQLAKREANLEAHRADQKAKQELVKAVILQKMKMQEAAANNPSNPANPQQQFLRSRFQSEQPLAQEIGMTSDPNKPFEVTYPADQVVQTPRGPLTTKAVDPDSKEGMLSFMSAYDRKVQNGEPIHPAATALYTKMKERVNKQVMGAPAGGSERPPSQAQETTALYASRIKQANGIFDKLESFTNNQNLVDMFQAGKPSWMQGEDMQSYEQAQRNFLNAVLRRESGAVISPSEFKEGKRQYFPQPGDKPAVIAQKKANRDLVMQNFIKAAGSAYVPYQESDGGASGGGESEDLSHLWS